MAEAQPLTRKRKRRAWLSNNRTSTNRKKYELLHSIQLPTSNTFAALDNEMDTHDQQTTTIAKKTSISPIVVTDHTTDVQAMFSELNLEKCNLKIISIGRKIFPSTAEEKEIIEKHLKTKNVDFYTHPGKSEKVFKVVLSGLPQVDVKVIETDLTAQKVTPTKITMFNTESKNKLYLIHFNAEQVNKKTLEAIKYVYHHVIKWQPYKPKRSGATICYRCCTYGHAQSGCFRYSVCMLCAGAHLTSACTIHKKGDKSNSTSFACFNCKSAKLQHDHKANDVSCPFREKYEIARNKARTKTTTNNRSQANTTSFVQARAPPPLRVSFADSMRTASSTSSRIHTNATATNNTQPHARANINARSSYPSTHSNDNNTNVNNNIWSFEECSNILFDSIERLQKCESKFEQLKVIADLLKYACK